MIIDDDDDDDDQKWHSEFVTSENPHITGAVVASSPPSQGRP